jgi:hypothetical protein
MSFWKHKVGYIRNIFGIVFLGIICLEIYLKIRVFNQIQDFDTISAWPRLSDYPNFSFKHPKIMRNSESNHN